MTVEWDDIGFVISSTYRTTVLRRLAESPSTPSQIGADQDIAVAHVSRTLQQLRDRSMVDLLVPEDRRKGRVYRLSEKGELVWEQTKEHNLA
jgi:predicted transcriptional regulator